MRLTSQTRKIKIKCMKVKGHLPAQRLILTQTVPPTQLSAFSAHGNNEHRKTLLDVTAQTSGCLFSFVSFYLFILS